MTADNPKVSIVLPTYNGSRYIRQSIDSCLNQTYPNIELIIVDDGSTDSTPDIIKAYTDPRIKYVRHVKNKGLPQALNTGFENVTGKYLTWTSDDNYYNLNAIEKELVFLKANSCSFVYCDFYRFTEDNLQAMQLVKLPDTLALEKSNDVGPCVLYSREVLEKVGFFDTQAELAEDYDYWIRVSKQFPMKHMAEVLYFYREHANSLSLARFSEVRAAEILVKSKNGLPYLDSLERFANLVSQRYPRWLGVHFLMRLLAVQKIKRKVRQFENGELTFSQARISLKELVK